MIMEHLTFFDSRSHAQFIVPLVNEKRLVMHTTDDNHYPKYNAEDIL